MEHLANSVEFAEGLFAPIFKAGTRLKSMWLRHTYPFAEFGANARIHPSCEILRSQSIRIRLGNDVYMAPGVWIESLSDTSPALPNLHIGDGCAIGRRCTISARNQVVLEANVLLAPSVLITDHYDLGGGPRQRQGGRVFIGRNCWLGIGSAIACAAGELHLGRNTVVAANAVVTESFPPFSVVAGNPAKLLKQYDEKSREWLRVGR